MPDEFINVERPQKVPLNPNGKSHQVIVRLVRPDLSETWRAATAVRWTDTHVLVGYERDDHERTYCWLRVDDVCREITRPAPRAGTSDVEQAATNPPGLTETTR